MDDNSLGASGRFSHIERTSWTTRFDRRDHLDEQNGPELSSEEDDSLSSGEDDSFINEIAETAHNCHPEIFVVNRAEDDQAIAQRKLRLIAELRQRRARYNSHKHFVDVDMDKIALPFFYCNHLFPKIAGASSAEELRLSFPRLTKRVCGYDTSLDKEQRAVYYSTHPWLI